MQADTPPLIVTLSLDPASQAWLDRLRSTYFPPERLVVGAHVTMFHALPGGQEAAVAACMAGLCAAAAPFAVRMTGLRFLGRGVAVALAAPEPAALRSRLAKAFAADLTPQDRAAWSPHATVQNKVTAERARRTYDALSGIGAPGPITATGLALWRYRGGPWEAAADWCFAA